MGDISGSVRPSAHIFLVYMTEAKGKNILPYILLLLSRFSYQSQTFDIGTERVYTRHYGNTPIQIYRKFPLPPPTPPPKKKKKKSQIKTLMFFIFLLKTDCGYSLEPPRRGSSYEYPQSMFLSKNMKNNIFPCKTNIKVGFKGVKII